MRTINRRQFLRLGGGLLGAAAASTALGRTILRPTAVVEATSGLSQATPDLHFAATDGWIHLPEDSPVPPYHPDNLAPPLLTTYIFGFRDVNGLGTQQIFAQKMKAQLTAPIWWLTEGVDFTLKVTNLGLQMRPDLVDSHTVHFHGFRNAIPIFDGEPHSSVGVPIARDLTYFYRPHDPGTYMAHCHFEETEHIHMGMVGIVFVRPAMGDHFVYNDASTYFDREFTMTLNDVWALAHWCDSHIQLPEWTDYKAEFYLLNGRCWPDTILPPGGGTDPGTGDLIPPPGHPELQYQPISSLVTCNAGERVLLRFVNLGFVEQTMSLTGLQMRVVGRDATLLRGRNGSNLTYMTDSALIGPGESVDAIFTAPNVAPPPGADYATYLLYNRNYVRQNNGGGTGFGGQMTEIRVYPGTLPPQTAPNT